MNSEECERLFREKLANKVSGTLVGIWLLIAEHLKLGSWDLIKQWCGTDDRSLEPRIAMQLVHEAALCVNGVRPKRSLCHQGFDMANGLPFIVTDQQVYGLLNKHTISEAKLLQVSLGMVRRANGHYKGGLISIDPHRIATVSKREMPKKKKRPREPSKKMLQTFFAINTHSGQPIASLIGSPGRKTSHATIELIELIDKILPGERLILADCEHFTQEILDYVRNRKEIDIVMPLPVSDKVIEAIQNLEYKRHWAGFSIAFADYSFNNGSEKYKMIIQRCGEVPQNYTYKPFISTSRDIYVETIAEAYPKRWGIEEFFNFEGKMNWTRASTMNLNVRYAKHTLALFAQAAIYQFRKKLPKPYEQWTAEHMANDIFHGLDGDIRAKDDKIIVTFYGAPEQLNLKTHYENLSNKLCAEGINPKVPWLYNYKLDFRFK